MAKIGTWNYDIVRDHLVWSSEVYRIFEIDPEKFEASLEAFMSAVHPDDRDAVLQAYQNSLLTGIPYNIEHRLLMPDGRIKYVIEACEIIHDTTGKAVSSLGTVQDITALKTLEAKEELQRQMLIQQSKLAQMGEMIDTIAHQWKQPLHQINSILPALERQYADRSLTQDALASKLDEIEMLTTHMASTVDRFRDFFHPRKTDTAFDVTDAIKDASHLIRSELERLDVTLDIKSESTLIVSGNKEEFVQAVLTILSNAIECFIHRKIEAPKLLIEVRREGAEITVRLSDNAGGIPEHFLNKVFDLYFTTKIKGHGTGLGLYIAKMLVEKSMKGTITAENAAEGAVFTIFLPDKEHRE